MLVADNSAGESQERLWYARLQLSFEKQNKRTVLVQRKHVGPLCVQKPFYPESDDVCHTYVLHPPAGVAGGDSLNIDVTLKEHAHAVITTPAATKFYKANPYAGSLSQTIDMKAGAVLEWLPQENIFFNGTKASIGTRINIDKEARFIAWDSQCFGRPASAEKFEQGEYKQRLEVWCEGQPLFIDAMGFAASGDFQHAQWGIAGNIINGLMLIYPADQQLRERLREQLRQNEEVNCALSLVDELLLLRVLGHDSEAVQNLFRAAWSIVRPVVLDKPAIPPRIWNT